jgi:hypothetical protein
VLGDEESLVNNFDEYVKRPVEFLKEVNSEGWRMKVYGISVKSQPLSKELVFKGIKAVISHLPKPALTL